MIQHKEANAMATAKATARKSTANAPKGMRMLEGGYAKTWNVDELPVLEGEIGAAPKTVTLNQGTKKQADRQCVEVRTKDGDRYTVWESAALTALFERLGEKGAIPCKVWIAFKGYGVAKKGQNAPKLFDVAISD
jgi:hypothetical protein